MKKIWPKQEVVLGVDGKPFAIKAGLFERLRASRESLDRIRHQRAKHGKNAFEEMASSERTA